jgi:hypothetical protein
MRALLAWALVLACVPTCLSDEQSHLEMVFIVR